MSRITILVPLLIPSLLVAETANREALVTKYCASCHNARAKIGGFVLDGVPVTDPAKRPDIWERVVRKVKAGEMPPAGMPTPGGVPLKAFASELVSDLDTAARQMPYARPTDDSAAESHRVCQRR